LQNRRFSVYSTDDGTHFNSIDNFGDNWWCRFLSPDKNQNYGGGFYYSFSKLRAPLEKIYPNNVVTELNFLSAHEKTVARDEFNALGQLAIEWAKGSSSVSERLSKQNGLKTRHYKEGTD
jgi:hypothetical protein